MEIAPKVDAAEVVSYNRRIACMCALLAESHKQAVIKAFTVRGSLKREQEASLSLPVHQTTNNPYNCKLQHKSCRAYTNSPLMLLFAVDKASVPSGCPLINKGP